VGQLRETVEPDEPVDPDQVMITGSTGSDRPAGGDQVFWVSQVKPMAAVPPWVESGAAALTV